MNFKSTFSVIIEILRRLLYFVAMYAGVKGWTWYIAIPVIILLLAVFPAERGENPTEVHQLPPHTPVDFIDWFTSFLVKAIFFLPTILGVVFYYFFGAIMPPLIIQARQFIFSLF